MKSVDFIAQFRIFSRESKNAPASKSEVRRWIEAKNVMVNGEVMLLEEIDFDVFSLVLFPKGKRVTLLQNCGTCANSYFEPETYADPIILEKYDITREQFFAIAARLEEKFSVGYCGWCVQVDISPKRCYTKYTERTGA